MKTVFYTLIITLTTSYFLSSCTSSRSSVASIAPVQYPTNISNLRTGNTEAEKRAAAYRSYQALLSEMQELEKKENATKSICIKPVENAGATAPYLMCMGQK